MRGQRHFDRLLHCNTKKISNKISMITYTDKDYNRCIHVLNNM